MENVIVRGEFRKPVKPFIYGTDDIDEPITDFKDLIWIIVKNYLDDDEHYLLYENYISFTNGRVLYKGDEIYDDLEEFNLKSVIDILSDPNTTFQKGMKYYRYKEGKNFHLAIEGIDCTVAEYMTDITGDYFDFTDWIAANEDKQYCLHAIPLLKDAFVYERLRSQGRAGSFFMKNGEVKSEWKKCI